MNVAEILPPVSKDTFITVTFYQSQRYYEFPLHGNPQYMELLKNSLKNRVPVIITRASEQSAVILRVERPAVKGK